MTKYYDPWSTHFGVLASTIAYAQSICSNNHEFKVLELGSGYYSTPMLHMMISPMKSKQLVTCESDHKWLDRFSNLKNSWHQLTHVVKWNSISCIDDEEWDVVFVDHAPTPRRAIDLLRIYKSNKTKFIVCHDTEDKYKKRYNWDSVFSKFKYKKRFDFFMPNTTVLSNYKEIPF